MHLEIYKKRPDVNAIIHTHAPYATGFAFSDKKIKRLEGYENMRTKVSKLLSLDKWITNLRQYTSSRKLTAEMLDAFVDKIKVYSDKRIEIVWKYTEDFSEYTSILNGGVKLAR